MYSNGAFVLGNRRAHHEDILQSCSGDGHFSTVLLLNDTCREHHFRSGLGLVDVLNWAYLLRSLYTYATAAMCVHLEMILDLTNSKTGVTITRVLLWTTKDRYKMSDD